MAIIQGGIPVARIELLDAPAVDAVQCPATRPASLSHTTTAARAPLSRWVAQVNKYSQLALRVTPTLVFEFHGSPAAVEEQAAAAGEIATDFGAQAFQWASSPEERARREPARGPRPAAPPAAARRESSWLVAWTAHRWQRAWSRAGSGPRGTWPTTRRSRFGPAAKVLVSVLLRVRACECAGVQALS